MIARIDKGSNARFWRYAEGPLSEADAFSIKIHDRLAAMERIGYGELKRLELLEDAGKLSNMEYLHLADARGRACGLMANNLHDYITTGTLRPVKFRAGGSPQFTFRDMLYRLDGDIGAGLGTKATAQEAILKQLNKDGARGMIAIERSEHAGHFLVAENIDGTLVVYDVSLGAAVDLNQPGAFLTIWDEPGAGMIPNNGVGLIITNQPK